MRSWKDHAEGFDFVDAGVGAVEKAGDFIEANFAGNPLLERLVEIFVNAPLHLAHAGFGRAAPAAAGARVGGIASVA